MEEPTYDTENKSTEEAKIEYMFNSLKNEIGELAVIVKVFTEEISSVLREENTKDSVAGLTAVEDGHSDMYYRLSELVGNVVDIQHLLISVKSRLEI